MTLPGGQSNHLGTIWRVDGTVDIGCVAPELLQQLARFQAMHACEAVIRGAEHVGSIPGEAERGDALRVRGVELAQQLPRLDLEHLRIVVPT